MQSQSQVNTNSSFFFFKKWSRVCADYTVFYCSLCFSLNQCHKLDCQSFVVSFPPPFCCHLLFWFSVFNTSRSQFPFSPLLPDVMGDLDATSVTLLMPASDWLGRWSLPPLCVCLRKLHASPVQSGQGYTSSCVPLLDPPTLLSRSICCQFLNYIVRVFHYCLSWDYFRFLYYFHLSAKTASWNFDGRVTESGSHCGECLYLNNFEPSNLWNWNVFPFV